MKRRIWPSSLRECWRKAGNLSSISITSSGRLAAVDEISRTLLVCFWNAFGNKTLTDIAFSHEPQPFIHGVALFHKVFKVGEPGANCLAYFIRVLQAVGRLQAVAGDTANGEFIRLDSAVRIEPRRHRGRNTTRGFRKHAFGPGKFLDGRDDLHIRHVFGPSPGGANGARSVRPVTRVAEGERTRNRVGRPRLTHL